MKIIQLFISFLLITGTSYAQLCQGSLGDPIVNITFGQGPNPGSALSAAATGYQYTPSDCPNDGFYTVRNNTNNCFGNSWHNLLSDHTGNSQGYFMLVNASYQPSDFYVDTVSGLCGNSTYEFAAWIMNVTLGGGCSGNTIQPNLTFQVETTTGTILKTYNTNNIATQNTATWRQYGSFFTTPPGTTVVVLRITNNAPGGCGNDLALDDITFRPCGPLLNPVIQGEMAATVNTCEGSASSFVFFCAVSGGFNNPVFQWQQLVSNSWVDIPGANANTLARDFPANLAPGIYSYRLSVAESGNLSIAQCRIASTPLSIRINATPVTSAFNNSPACEGANLTLQATGGTQYNWTGPNSFTGTGTPVVLTPLLPDHAGIYYVLVRNEAGCTKTDSTTVVVQPRPKAAVPFSDTIVCEGDSVRLMVNDAPGFFYEWFPETGISQPHSYEPNVSPSVYTNYGIALSNSLGCRDTAYIRVSIKQKPVVDAGPAKFLLAGQSVQLQGSIAGNYSNYAWSPGQYISNEQTLLPLVNPPMDLVYYLSVQSACGNVQDSVAVKLYSGLFIPNVFTPNNDGLNDVWNIPAMNAFPGFELYVYNRFGQLVYFNRDNHIPWNGRFKGQEQPAAAYTYLVKINKAPFLIKGTLLIVR